MTIRDRAEPHSHRVIKTLNFIVRSSSLSETQELTLARRMTQTFPIILFEIFLNVWDIHCESSHQLECLDRIADYSCDVSCLGFVVQQSCLEVLDIPEGGKCVAFSDDK